MKVFNINHQGNVNQKTTMMYHLTPVRGAIIERTIGVGGDADEGERTHVHCW